MSYKPRMYVPPEFKEMVDQIVRESRRTNSEVMRELTRCCNTGTDPMLHFKKKGWLK